MIPTTSSVSQLTTTAINTNNINDENTKNISKQYVSDYILSQPFDSNEKEDEEINMNRNGANTKINPTIAQPRKRLLPTAHIRRQQQQQQQQQKESKDESSSEHEDDAASSPESASNVDDNESVPRGRIFMRIFFLRYIWKKKIIMIANNLSIVFQSTKAWYILGHMLSNDAWQKDEILAAKLKKFLTTVHFI